MTITVAVLGSPEQPLAHGVIVKVTVTGAPVLLVNVPEILPLPAFAIPVIAGISLVQLYVVPETVPLMMIGVIGLPEHIFCVPGVAVTVGLG